jgi:hypothetical protein
MVYYRALSDNSVDTDNEVLWEPLETLLGSQRFLGENR